MARNIILTGGHTHPFDTAAPALAALLAECGIESTISEDIEAGLVALDMTRPELLTLYALRWRMLGSEKHVPFRARWGFSLSAGGRAAIASHLARGGGLLALHTAIICFDDWPAWKQIIGGVWVWGRSGHPPYGKVQVEPEDGENPLLRGLSGFTLDDEVYGDLDFEPGVRALMRARAETGNWQPVLWTRVVGGGRVAVDALGHDAGAFAHPVHRRIVARAALWALGRSDVDIGAA